MTEMDASRHRAVNGHVLALVSWILLLLVSGTLLTALLERWHDTHPATMRNHHYARGWLEHAGEARPRGTNENLVVLIGNSQGFGLEVSDAQSYARLLQDHLTRRWGNTRVLNWCLPGATGQEFVILAARAQRLNPDVLLLVTGPGNFDAALGEFDAREKQPKPWLSDVYRLLGDPKVRRRLPRSFLSQYFSLSDFVDGGLSNTSKLWRHRHVPVSWFAQFRTFQQFEPSMQREAILWPLRIPGYTPQEAISAPTQEDIRAVSPTLLNHYLDVAGKVARHRYFVVMPLHSLRRRDVTESVSAFRRLADHPNHQFLDISALVPDDSFITPTHVDAQGHISIAGTIAARLPNSLSTVGAP